MTGERVRCPSCRQNVPGAGTVGRTTYVGYSRGYVTFENGSLPCRCGAQLIMSNGRVIEHTAPGAKAPEGGFIVRVAIDTIGVDTDAG